MFHVQFSFIFLLCDYYCYCCCCLSRNGTRNATAIIQYHLIIRRNALLCVYCYRSFQRAFLWVFFCLRSQTVQTRERWSMCTSGKWKIRRTKWALDKNWSSFYLKSENGIMVYMTQLEMFRSETNSNNNKSKRNYVKWVIILRSHFLACDRLLKS